MRVLFVCATALLLGACEALLPPQPSVAPSAAAALVATRSAVLAGLDTWALNGRISIRQADDAWHGSIQWSQIGEAFAIRITAPLGQGGFLLHGGSEGVVLQTARDEAYQAADAETLLFDHLGWRVPLAGLRYWAIGYYDPKAPYTVQHDPSGRIVTLQQAGWVIDFQRYVDVDGFAMPAKVFMENDTLDVRLVIDQWQLQDRGSAPDGQSANPA